MDSWAGMEHQIVYKKDVKLTPEMQAELDRCAELSAELDEKMDNLRKSVSEKMNEE
jgi:putative GTP pyrophosphokinase